MAGADRLPCARPTTRRPVAAARDGGARGGGGRRRRTPLRAHLWRRRRRDRRAGDAAYAVPLGLGFQDRGGRAGGRSEEHTSELQSLMRNSYAVFCLNKKN